jgi:asparagine synthase (glutamine-hydrolysing)
MCGIFFSIGFENPPPSVIDSVSHRGPDGRGWEEFSSSQGPVVMAHRRLAIVDLSEDGHQPMSSEDGRYSITYNGEIYNYLEIRKELEDLGYYFKTETDTEVLLKSYLQWNKECLHHFNGMFAFIIWDDKDKKIFAARDRFGVKPLYYYRQGNKIAFASEIKQFKQIANFEARIDREHLSFFLQKKYHPISATTFFRDVKQIEPGNYVTNQDNQYVIKNWYNPRDHIYTIKNPEEEFLALFQDSVVKRLVADVPIGALLSGGLDSSSIVCIVGELLKTNVTYKNIQTFTSWSPNSSVDEKIYSDAVIEKTGLVNHLAEITDDSLQSSVQELIYHQEEPFFSTSVHSEWNIYKTIQSTTNLKVVLDGQGSDELMCGYLFMIPHLLSHYLKNGSPLQAIKEFFHTIQNHGNLSRISLGGDILSRKFPQTIHFIQKMRGKTFNIEDQENFDKFQDYTFYLLRHSIEPQLRWQDRSSMAFSIESRQPFLDYRLVEFLLSLSPDKKFNQGTTKILLRKTMQGILPESVRKRTTKFGFPTPQETLMNNMDRDFFSKYLQKGISIIKDYDALSFKNSADIYCATGLTTELFFPFSLGLWTDKFQVSV